MSDKLYMVRFKKESPYGSYVDNFNCTGFVSRLNPHDYTEVLISVDNVAMSVPCWFLDVKLCDRWVDLAVTIGSGLIKTNERGKII